MCVMKAQRGVNEEENGEASTGRYSESGDVVREWTNRGDREAGRGCQSCSIMGGRPTTLEKKGHLNKR